MRGLCVVDAAPSAAAAAVVVVVCSGIVCSATAARCALRRVEELNSRRELEASWRCCRAGVQTRLRGGAIDHLPPFARRALAVASKRILRIPRESVCWCVVIIVVGDGKIEVEVAFPGSGQ